MGEDSLEFCGGTHLNNTAKVGPFRIQSEASVASGVRRIEAYTGKEVLHQTERMNRMLLSAANELKTTPKDLLHRAHAIMLEMKELRQSIERMKDKLFCGEIERCLFSAKSVNGLKVLTLHRDDVDAADLRKMGDQIRDREPNAVAVLATTQGEKIILLAVCGKEAVARRNQGRTARQGDFCGLRRIRRREARFRYGRRQGSAQAGQRSGGGGRLCGGPRKLRNL